MSTLSICIPEMQQEIKGLTINTQSSSGWLTSADLSNPSITSQNCNKTLTVSEGAAGTQESIHQASGLVPQVGQGDSMRMLSGQTRSMVTVD